MTAIETTPMKFVRHLLGLKDRLHRDLAAEIFVAHCEAEAKKLQSVVNTALNERAAHSNATRLQLVSDVHLAPNSPAVGAVAQSLLGSHCFALTLATGLRAIYGNIDPSSQDSVIVWAVHSLIVAKDVGEENVGHAPTPYPTPGVHVSYAPGTLAGGVASELQKFVRLYEEMKTAPHKLVLLLVSLGAIAPTNGIEKKVFREEKIGEGFVAQYLLGTVTLGKPITEWADDLVIKDADAALSELPKVSVDQMVSAIQGVNPFWPEFSRQHRLTW